jgi:uncharacterized protein DUF5916
MRATLAVFLLFPSLLFAQTPSPPELVIPRVEHPPRLEEFLNMTAPVELDGRLAKVSDFLQRQPRDNEPATQRTDVYVGYDDANLYTIFVCFDTDPESIRARMNPRGNTNDDDWAHVVLDTFHDKRHAYVFSATALGVQWDALWTEGQPFDAAWDALYYSRGARTNEGYVVWLAIPFKSLRFSPDAEQEWGIMFGRSIPRLNEQSFWPQYSSRIEGRLNQEATVVGLKDISPGRNIQFLPFTGFRSYRAIDQRDPARPYFARDAAAADLGLDAKLVLKDSFVTDIAINPDFSQVESDEPQVTTNQRFEVFFPEKRPFFLENANFFQTPINLVFTRRIADPQFGARLTGKAGPYAIGALVTDDESPGKRVLDYSPAFGKRARFGILRLNREILSQSSVGMIFTERSFLSTFNRVAGVDSRVKLSRTWVTQLQAVTSSTRFSDGTHRAGPAYEAQLNRYGRQLNFNATYSDRSPGFVTLAGFNPRTDIRNLTQRTSYAFRPEGKYWISMTPTLNAGRITAHDGKLLEWSYNPFVEWEFTGQTFFGVAYAAANLRLRPSEAPVTSDRNLSQHHVGAYFRTSIVPQIQLGGSYYTGTDVNYAPVSGQNASTVNWSTADFSLTLRPVTQLTIANRYLFTKLAERETNATIFNDHIIRSRLNWQFTRELSARFIVQYNADLVNARYTSIEHRKNINADFLFTYQVNAWTALYAGYNSNAQNIDLVATSTRSKIVRTTEGFINDAHQFFAKFSYLIRF